VNATAGILAAIQEARKAQGNTHPNPAVGAVITDPRQVLARGHTQPAGGAHAEIMAIQEFERAGIHPGPEHTLFVTLEPCSTHGRTPPCTDAIIASGIRRVVIGATDPNPEHAGQGVPLLEAAGIEVETGVLEERCEDLNLIFNHWIVNQTPLIAGKIATTIDGYIAARSGHSKWITGPEAREDVMNWRRYFPAIAVGAGTVTADDPALTARMPDKTHCPVRFVFDRHLITLRDDYPALYTDEWADRTIIVTSEEKLKDTRTFASGLPVQFWGLTGDSPEEEHAAFRSRCLEEGLFGILVEGGSTLLSQLLQTGNLDYLLAYRAPKLLADPEALSPFRGQSPGRIDEGFELTKVRQARFGDDQLIRGFVRRTGR